MLFLPLLAAVLPNETDTLKNFDIETAVVVAQPKETRQLREQPLSVSLFDGKALEQRRVQSVKDITAYAPNFFMPDYGSRLTSAVYIRGIGSRINTPAVGLYVDNIPYTDKTAYNFSFAGVERVDVLRGPQGTLYGRNTMGGLLRVYTANPLTHKGTEVSAGIGTNSLKGMTRQARFTTFIHPTSKMGLSVGGYYEGEKGSYTNLYNRKRQDKSEAGGGRLRLAWQPTNVVKIDWSAAYEYVKERICPYYLLGQATDFSDGYEVAAHDADRGRLSQNRPSQYSRHLFNTGLNVSHQLPRTVITSITAFQHLRDRDFMDQDFTDRDIFSLEQKQKISTVSEEIALKSVPSDHRWQWTTGVFAMYQWLNTTCPVTFYDDGVSYLNNQIGQGLPQQPQIGVAFTGNTLPFVSQFKTPTINAALFHQSTVRLFAGLSMTLGVRLDYDAHRLDMQSGVEGTEGYGSVPYHFSMAMGPTMRFNTDLDANPTFGGTMTRHAWQVLPKGALNYTLPSQLGNIYFSVAKGYRSGGYNIQSYADLSQQLLRRDMMMGVKNYSTEQINALPMPDAVKQKALAGMTGIIDKYTPAAPELSSLYYKPEYTWNYEVGIHHNLADKALQLDLSAFYMKTRDQQIARFSESGMGRVMVNAGRSRSTGVEVGLRSQLLSDRLNLAANYGYTKATFTNYDLGTQSGTAVNYTGNRVPYVPMHTMSASVDYRQPFANDLCKALSVGADVKGAGNVMWNEANTFSARFYATLGARLSVEMAHGLTFTLWGCNLTNTRYATFAFDSMNNRFAQYGRPCSWGMDVKWAF